jgi:hypothetical protein
LSGNHIDARLWEQHDNTDKEVAQRRIKTYVCIHTENERELASMFRRKQKSQPGKKCYWSAE